MFLRWLDVNNISLIKDLDAYPEHLTDHAKLIKEYVKYRKLVTPTVVMPWPPGPKK